MHEKCYSLLMMFCGESEVILSLIIIIIIFGLH